ncbi:Transmembrane amino acid transporter family protein, partial [Metarhizium majus ARSEF 297]
MSVPAGLISAEGDPRLSVAEKPPQDVVHQPIHGNDSTITFEEFIYWAERTRADEALANKALLDKRGPRTVKNTLQSRFSKGHQTDPATSVADIYSSDEEIIMGISEREWKQASRAIRTASWGSIFYLITTDVLGPFSTPWAFAQMGYGPGVALYTVFGAMAGYSGWIIWKAFLGLDSDRYPMHTYGDIYFRIFGRIPQTLLNIMLGLQLLLSVCSLILSNGQSISQISQGNNGSNGNGICFVACLIIFMAAGFVLGQIRTLQRFGWIANFAVWINVAIIFICVGVVVHYPPNFKATQASFGDNFGPGPIRTFAGTPPDGFASGGTGFVASLNGLNQAVYSYGGCMTFTAFLAEMRHPMDFWKGLLCGQVFIYSLYMFFGIFVYSYQGQFAFNPVMQGLSSYGFQTATNVMNLVTGLIAAGLYGNIGLKVIYIEVFERLFKFPPLTVRKGKIMWAVTVPVYWSIAFIVAAAIPQFSYISGLIGAFFVLSFSYTFPALMALGFWIHKDAMVPEQEKFDPQTRTYNYVDTGLVRWKRGFLKRPFFNLFNLVYMLGGLTTTGLGVYSSIEGLIAAFSGSSVASSFGCRSPV